MLQGNRIYFQLSSGFYRMLDQSGEFLFWVNKTPLYLNPKSRIMAPLAYREYGAIP